MIVYLLPTVAYVLSFIDPQWNSCMQRLGLAFGLLVLQSEI
jgi:hypothetical protein